MRTRIREALAAFGVARFLILGVVLLLFTGAWWWKVDPVQLGSDSLWRVGMNLILVLSLLPMVKGGTGLNFGLPIGFVAGLLGVVIVLNANGTGWSAFFAATALAIVLAIPLGILYGMTLNAVRGNEMMVGIYLGWSAVSLFSLVWALGPFHNPKLVWAIGGRGLRTTLQMEDSFGRILDDALLPLEQALFGGFRVRLGLLLFCALLFVLVALFFRTRLGLTIRAAGENVQFAAAAGVRVDRIRVVAATLSTVLAAVGAVVYSQSYGFAQLYQAPLMMALPAVAAILIGGGSTRHATIFYVIVGVALFQSILVQAPPVLKEAVKGGDDISEALRITIQNGMILYALTRRGGGS